MSYGRICWFLGCTLLACGSNEAGSEGTAGASLGGQASGGQASGKAGATSGGKTDGDAGAAAGGKPSGQAGEKPSEGGKLAAGEGGSGGSAGPEPLDALSGVTVPFAGEPARPEAYRVSITFGDGSADEVAVTRGDAIQRPERSDMQVLKASLPVTQGNDELSIRQEGLSLSVVW